MPTGENVDPIGARVTRSLRKRLTSIDSDVPSRPGTPNNVNLQTIPETNTPKKRTTRRASLSTPSAITPSKETTNTPGRRFNRRRSVNISESEDQIVPTMSKETTIDVVKEEEHEGKTPNTTPKRVLRSSSKSPIDAETINKKKQLSKETTNYEDQDVINLDDSIDINSQALKPPRATKKTGISVKRECLFDEEETEKSNYENESTPTKKSANLSAIEKSSDKKNKSVQKRLSVTSNVTPAKSSTNRPLLRSQITPEQLNSDKGSATKNKSAQKEKQVSDVKSSPLVLKKIEETPSNKKNVSIISIDSSLKETQPEPSKNVAFNEEVDENKVKNVYPKTPCSIKTKSHIQDVSNNETFKSKTDKSFDGIERKSDHENSEEEQQTARLNTKTPHKLKLMAVESSTPIQNVSPKRNNTSEIQKQNEKSVKENVSTEVEEGVSHFPKSWTTSVSGTTRETSKIDSIVSEKVLEEKQAQDDANKSQSNTSNNISKNKFLEQNSDSSEAEDDMLEEDNDEYYNDDEEERDRRAEKTVFLDDEAMEVADGEESMDSEERAYLEENEIPEYGESIGSQDSIENEEDDEEPDEEDAAFVVSDTEVVDELLSSEDELETSKKSKSDKKYKRIMRVTESSDEESKHPTNKDDTDLCLYVESSFEEENIENANQPDGFKDPNKSLSKKSSYADVKNKSANHTNLKDESKLKNSKINKTDEGDVLGEKKGENPEKVEVSNTIPSENDVSKKDVAARKSEVIKDTDIKSSPSKSKLLKKASNLNNSKDNNSNTEMVEKGYTTITESKPEISENDDDSGKHEEQSTSLKSPEKKKLDHSPKRLNQSPKRKSLTTQSLPCDDGFESLTEKPLNQSRKSVHASENLENLIASPNKSLNEKEHSIKESKSPSKSNKRLRKMSTISADEGIDEHEPKAKKSPTNKKISPSPKRRSITIPTPDASEDEKQYSAIKDCKTSANKSKVCDTSFKSTNEKSLNQSRKSIKGKLIDTTVNEESIDGSEMKSIDNSNSTKNVSLNEEKEKVRKSLNESRKSLIRTSTEESNDAKNHNTLENTQEKEFDPEETLSGCENLFDTSAGKTLNTSKTLRKSFDQNSSLKREESNEHGISRRRKSIAQQSILEKGSESSSESEEENEEKSNEQSNDKYMNRKSISQQCITQKDSDSSPESEEYHDGKSSPEITDNEMESSSGDEAEAKFSDEKSASSISDIVGEEDKTESSFKKNSSRRKSIVNNESKLDETFQLDPKTCLSSSLHDSLHRSILRKSLNQSQKRKETLGSNRDDIDEDEEAGNSSEDEEEEVKIEEKIVSEKNLSVSLNSIQIKKKKLKDAKAIRNSFTIGVSVRKNSTQDEDSAESDSGVENKLSLQNVDSAENNDSLESQDSSSENKILNLSEKQVLEKVQDVQHVGPYKSRKSMSNSKLPSLPSDSAIKQKKRIKRTSLYQQDETASNSFVEKLAIEKTKIKQQKRKSNSFCGAIVPSTADDDVQLNEPRSEKKLKKSFEPENDEENVKKVLSRCELMIEAANEAKRKAKLQAKKVKVKKPKWMDKEEAEERKVDDEVEIPLVSKKEMKRKEKMKKELAKALKQSASVLSKANEPITKKANVPTKVENLNPSKRLEPDFLESLMKLSNANNKKAKEMETTPPSDKENSKKKSNKLKYKIEDINTNNEPDIETLETASGTVVVEPATPQKLRFQHGFRESPKTPIGFKIQNINSNNRKTEKILSRKLKTPSGSFVEEDLNKSNKKKTKGRKRKHPREIEEPTYTLPKTQWTPSGVFIEEDLSNARPLANSTATQFLVASLNNNKKNKSSSEVISSTTLSKALLFKKNAIQNSNVCRQNSREILYVKRRKIANTQF